MSWDSGCLQIPVEGFPFHSYKATKKYKWEIILSAHAFGGAGEEPDKTPGQS